jgi:hypothetical protein
MFVLHLIVFLRLVARSFPRAPRNLLKRRSTPAAAVLPAVRDE